MQSARRRDTAPELALRRRLHSLGYRYFVDRAPLPGLRRRADLLFPRRRVAIYVDGCFWHSCPEHGTLPKANADWWADKLRGNWDRDRDTDDRLATAGWTVVRVWEHTPVDDAVTEIERAFDAAPTARPWPDDGASTGTGSRKSPGNLGNLGKLDEN
jgi:DNA mismatch endonuclease (patch repair protein)